MIPDWLKRLPNDAYLNTDEVKRAFGYSEKSSISHFKKYGSIPEPDIYGKRFSECRHQKPFWNVGRIKKILRGKCNG